MLTRRKLLHLLPFGAVLAACRKACGRDSVADMWHTCTFKAPDSLTPKQRECFDILAKDYQQGLSAAIHRDHEANLWQDGVSDDPLLGASYWIDFSHA